ncbi:MAG: glycosyltransferase family 2 protein [Methylomicrobium sp.]|nr:glycosyltransferase family 2 protein [Methylomicrobium sp.]
MAFILLSIFGLSESIFMPSNVFAVIVTYNRLPLLQLCVGAIQSQTKSPDHILIIDNASTDGTDAWIHGISSNIIYIRLTDNRGGAGGFAEGIQQALVHGADWIWMMDDDAEPLPNALEELLFVSNNPSHIYGSVAISGEYTSWGLSLVNKGNIGVDLIEDIPDRARVQFLPFLGFMIHRDLVNKMGLPDAGFFIAADDVEYCMRAASFGAQVIVAGKSRIKHPKAITYTLQLPGRSFTCLQLPPWKRYYDTRNRLFIARQYYGLRFWTHTIPASFLRLFGALRYEPRKLAQLWAFFTGFYDGLLNIKGKRHPFWHIN